MSKVTKMWGLVYEFLYNKKGENWKEKKKQLSSGKKAVSIASLFLFLCVCPPPPFPSHFVPPFRLSLLYAYCSFSQTIRQIVRKIRRLRRRCWFSEMEQLVNFIIRPPRWRSSLFFLELIKLAYFGSLSFSFLF